MCKSRGPERLFTPRLVMHVVNYWSYLNTIIYLPTVYVDLVPTKHYLPCVMTLFVGLWPSSGHKKIYGKLGWLVFGIEIWALKVSTSLLHTRVVISMLTFCTNHHYMLYLGTM